MKISGGIGIMNICWSVTERTRRPAHAVGAVPPDVAVPRRSHADLAVGGVICIASAWRAYWWASSANDIVSREVVELEAFSIEGVLRLLPAERASQWIRSSTAPANNMCRRGPGRELFRKLPKVVGGQLLQRWTRDPSVLPCRLQDLPSPWFCPDRRAGVTTRHCR